MLLVVTSLFATSQNATYFADSLSYYPDYQSDTHRDKAVNIRITLREDSLMVIHDRDKNITTIFRLLHKLTEEIDSTRSYKALSFLMEKQGAEDEMYIVALVYKRAEAYLHILGLTEVAGTDMVLFFIIPKEGRGTKIGDL